MAIKRPTTKEEDLPNELQALAEGFRLTLNIVRDFIDLAGQNMRGAPDTADSLLSAACRYSDDLYSIYARIDAFANAEPKKGCAS